MTYLKHLCLVVVLLVCALSACFTFILTCPMGVSLLALLPSKQNKTNKTSQRVHAQEEHTPKSAPRHPSLVWACPSTRDKTNLASLSSDQLRSALLCLDPLCGVGFSSLLVSFLLCSALLCVPLVPTHLPTCLRCRCKTNQAGASFLA